MGDWIMFRGRRRFVIGVRSSGLVLKRVRPSRCRFPTSCVFYSVSAREKTSTRVVTRSTMRARAKARRLLETSMPPWTTIVWDGDEPTYVHGTARLW